MVVSPASLPARQPSPPSDPAPSPIPCSRISLGPPVGAGGVVERHAVRPTARIAAMISRTDTRIPPLRGSPAVRAFLSPTCRDAQSDSGAPPYWSRGDHAGLREFPKSAVSLRRLPPVMSTEKTSLRPYRLDTNASVR